MASPEKDRHASRSTDAASSRNSAAPPPLGSTKSTASHETRSDSKSGAAKPAKRSRKNRNRKRRHRRQSFLAPEEEGEEEEQHPEVQQPLAATAPSGGPDSVASVVAPVAAGADQQQPNPLKSRSKSTRECLPFYGSGRHLSNLSETSLESEALLDHRYVLLFIIVLFSYSSSV